MILRRTTILAMTLLSVGASAQSQEGALVIDTLHNLSATGPGEIRAVDEVEICKFCHVPHNAVAPVPLWGHALSEAAYKVPEVRDASSRTRRPAPQPDGASRLCLSCHDGTVALGDVANRARPIEMRGSGRLNPGRRGFIGTDLSGSHPVSIVMPAQEKHEALQDLDMSLNPIGVVLKDPDIRLDNHNKIQCTSCHDPHADSYYQPGLTPRFWVKPTVEEVCLTCHAVR
jgi:hypothetical protein